MAKWTIFRVYEVPANTAYEATDVMREAIALHVERDYHVKDILRGPDETGRLRTCLPWARLAGSFSVWQSAPSGPARSRPKRPTTCSWTTPWPPWTYW